MLFAKDQHMIQTVAPQRPDQALPGTRSARAISAISADPELPSPAAGS